MIQSVINHNGSGCSRSSFLANKSKSFTWDKGRPPTQHPPARKTYFTKSAIIWWGAKTFKRALKSWLWGWYFSFYLRKEREMVIESEGSHQEKNGLFSGQADRKGWHCPLTVNFSWFFCWCAFVLGLWLKRILHTKKVISFNQILESPNAPYCCCSVTKWSGSDIEEA